MHEEKCNQIRCPRSLTNEARIQNRYVHSSAPTHTFNSNAQGSLIHIGQHI